MVDQASPNTPSSAALATPYEVAKHAKKLPGSQNFPLAPRARRTPGRGGTGAPRPPLDHRPHCRRPKLACQNTRASTRARPRHPRTGHPLRTSLQRELPAVNKIAAPWHMHLPTKPRRPPLHAIPRPSRGPPHSLPCCLSPSLRAARTTSTFWGLQLKPISPTRQIWPAVRPRPPAISTLRGEGEAAGAAERRPGLAAAAGAQGCSACQGHGGWRAQQRARPAGQRPGGRRAAPWPGGQLRCWAAALLGSCAPVLVHGVGAHLGPVHALGHLQGGGGGRRAAAVMRLLPAASAQGDGGHVQAAQAAQRFGQRGACLDGVDGDEAAGEGGRAAAGPSGAVAVGWGRPQRCFARPRVLVRGPDNASSRVFRMHHV
jgi:hypothetical protein